MCKAWKAKTWKSVQTHLVLSSEPLYSQLQRTEGKEND